MENGNGWEVIFGFVGGGHETTNVKDEARALSIVNAIYAKTGGAAAWISLHADADGHRLALCTSGKGPLHTMRIRRASNGSATIAEPPAAETTATKPPKPEPPSPLDPERTEH